MRREEGDAVVEDAAPADIVDVVFAISGRSLPVDHAYALSQAIATALPWFADEPGAGLHTIHGAASGSGWMRPEGADALLQQPVVLHRALRRRGPRGLGFRQRKTRGVIDVVMAVAGVGRGFEFRWCGAG